MVPEDDAKEGEEIMLFFVSLFIADMIALIMVPKMLVVWLLVGVALLAKIIELTNTKFNKKEGANDTKIH